MGQLETVLKYNSPSKSIDELVEMVEEMEKEMKIVTPYDVYTGVDREIFKGEFAMTAFHLGNTLSKNGTVSRGICETENGYLKKVTEYTKIGSDGSYVQGDATGAFEHDVPVSMNLWGLTPDIFDILEEEFASFLANADLMKDEFFIPSVISKALETGRATVKVYKNADKWYGITYREDLAEVKEAIGGYINDGLYEGI
jgi:hypothetical protein